MSLKDKEYESYRRVAPGRTVEPRNRPGVQESEEYALAVVGPDGASVGTPLEALLDELLYEVRALRVAMTLAGTAEDIGDGVEGRI